MNRFTGKTVIVTGSSKGIGAATARGFAGEGANVVLNSRSRADCEALAVELDDDRTMIVEGDVSQKEFADEIMAKTLETFGALDVLVNNAGIVKPSLLVDASDEDIDAQIGINLKSVIYLSRAAIPELAKTKGCIVNTSSVSGIRGDFGMPIYNATKGGVDNLTRALALQLGAQKIRVNAVNPSHTRTNMTDGMENHGPLMEDFNTRMPLGEPADPDDIAGPILFLASADARMITGVCLPVDGGVTASNGQPNFMKYF